LMPSRLISKIFASWLTVVPLSQLGDAATDMPQLSTSRHAQPLAVEHRETEAKGRGRPGERSTALERERHQGVREHREQASCGEGRRAVALRCPREVGGQETEGGGDAAGEDYEQPELAEPPRAPSA